MIVSFLVGCGNTQGSSAANAIDPENPATVTATDHSDTDSPTSSQAGYDGLLQDPVGVDNYRNASVQMDDSKQEEGLSFAPEGNEPIYYIASDGSADNDGLSEEKPWNLDVMNGHKPEGPAIYLFRRGDTFRGQIKSKMQKENLKIGAYGTGTKPLFLGSVRITNWKSTSDMRISQSVRDRVLEADLSAVSFDAKEQEDQRIHYLFAQRQLVTLARHPNVNSPVKTNWLTIDTKTGDYSFYDAEMQTCPSLSTGTLRVRAYSWQFSSAQIAQCESGQITIQEASIPWFPTREWGYYVDNVIEYLDHPGEWYYDKEQKKIFFYPPEGINPETDLIEGTYLGTGISVFWKQHLATIKDLSFKHFFSDCISINNSDDIEINNVNAQFCNNGLYVYNTSGLRISHSHIDRSITLGINLGKHQDRPVIIENNSITNNGIFPVLGARVNPYLQGIGIKSLNSDQVQIQGNEIINSGYSAIEIGTVDSSSAMIKNNFIQGSLLTLNDGGAITLRGSNISVIGNIILSTFGNINDGSDGYASNKEGASRHGSYGMGIFSYENLSNNVISGNTIAYARDIGIMASQNNDLTIQDNVTYGNEVNIQAKKGGQNTLISGNTIYSAQNIIIDVGRYSEHIGLEVYGDHTGLQIDKNRYCAPYSEDYIVMDGHYDLASFQHFKNKQYDANSTSCDLRMAQFEIESEVESLVSEDFEDCVNENQWTTSSQISGGQCYDQTDKTGSHSLHKEDATQDPDYFQAKISVSFQKGQTYLVQFDSFAEKPFVYRFRLAETIDGEFTRLIAERYVPFNSVISNHRFMFEARMDMTTKPSLSFFEGESAPVWIDNVRLVRVNPKPTIKTSLVFTPAALVNLAVTGAHSALLINKSSASQIYSIPEGYQNLAGEIGTQEILPFQSMVIVRQGN